MNSKYFFLPLSTKRTCKVKGCGTLFSFVWSCLHDWKDYQIGIIALFEWKGKRTIVPVCVSRFCNSRVKAVLWTDQHAGRSETRERVKSTGWYNQAPTLPWLDVAWHHCCKIDECQFNRAWSQCVNVSVIIIDEWQLEEKWFGSCFEIYRLEVVHVITTTLYHWAQLDANTSTGLLFCSCMKKIRLRGKSKWVQIKILP